MRLQEVIDLTMTKCCLRVKEFGVRVNRHDMEAERTSTQLIDAALWFTKYCGYSFVLSEDTWNRIYYINFTKTHESKDLDDDGRDMIAHFKLKRMMHLTNAIYE